MTSPLPRNDSATAESTAFSFAGSMACTTDCRFSNTVLTSTVTLRECSTEPGFSGSALAPPRHDEVDVLGAERGAGLDLRLDVARQVLELARVDLQLQLRNGRPPHRIRCRCLRLRRSARRAISPWRRSPSPGRPGRTPGSAERSCAACRRTAGRSARSSPRPRGTAPAPTRWGRFSRAGVSSAHHAVTPTGGSCRTARRRTA